MKKFEEVLDERVQAAEQIIYSYLPREEGYQKTVLEAMNYTMKAGGKRIRPLLMRETYHLFGGNHKIIEPFMAAIEMIHTYSLVHDDLPALDNDDYRRGRKTAHVVYGEDMAILAGDALLNFAYETAASAFLEAKDSQLIGKAMMVLTKKPGIYGMIGGQTADVELTGKELSTDQLTFIHRLKTGALIEASMMVGAILAGASDDEVKKIEQIAADIGMAFQIEDDILDVTSTMDALGKPINSDERNKKITYVTKKGLEQAKKDAEEISLRATKSLEELPYKNEFLSELILYLIQRKK